MPAEDLLTVYSSLHRRWQPETGSEESTDATKTVANTQPTVLDEDAAVGFAAARKMWVRTERLYLNRGRAHPGNQLDDQGFQSRIVTLRCRCATHQLLGASPPSGSNPR